MLTDIDKEGTASVAYSDFVEMVTPKVSCCHNAIVSAHLYYLLHSSAASL
jgi:hypothetical protein